VATNTGYQQFEAYVTLNATAPISDDTTGNDNNQTIDTEYSVIGNIYMFPLGTTAGDISIYVEYDNERVVGATVQLQQNIANNTTTTQITGRLTPSSGTLTNFTATTDANGLATFSSDLLVLGGHYEVRVLPATHEGLQLALTSGTDIVAGTSNNTQLVNITDTEPGTQTDALYAVLATNNDSDDATGTTNPGRLQITFNRAIAIYSEDGFTATLTNAGAAALTDPAGPGSVTASLSTDGLTLILTPNFATSPTAADLGCDITYVSGGITLDGDEQGDSLNIFNVNDIAYLDGTAVSNTVHIIGSD